MSDPPTPLYLLPINVKIVVSYLGRQEVNNHPFGRAGVQDKVVVCAPPCQVLDLPSIVSFVFVQYETYYTGVICKLNNHVCGVKSRAVMSERIERARLSAHACGVPVFRNSVDNVRSPIITTRGL